jgi:hypothetical protein
MFTKIMAPIRVRDPSGTNHHGENPSVARVDLIAGEITGPLEDSIFIELQ